MKIHSAPASIAAVTPAASSGKVLPFATRTAGRLSQAELAATVDARLAAMWDRLALEQADQEFGLPRARTDPLASDVNGHL